MSPAWLLLASWLVLHLLPTSGQDLFLAADLAQNPSGYEDKAAVAAASNSSTSSLPASKKAGSVMIQLAVDTDAPVTGRVRVYFQRHNRTLPVDGNSDEQDTNQVFGIDANALRSGDLISISEAVLGYPVKSLKDLQSGDYFVQAELFRYTLFNRSGLPPTWLPTTCVSSEGKNGGYAKPEGTLLSKVQKVTLPLHDSTPTLTLDSVQPAARSPGCAGLGDGVDSDYIKTVRIESKMLTEFWGTPIQLEACVLLPHQFNCPDRTNARYPLVVAHGHYSPEWWAGGGFQTTEPQCSPEEDGYPCVGDWYAYYLYQNWTADSSGPFVGARMLLMTINHPVPFFDDSYAVNSASMGPYGDAIVKELIPTVESRYRGLGAGWARGVFGGSTGGWESFAYPVLYPKDFNAAFAACPDPVTFSRFTSVNLYKQENAYFYDSDFKRTAMPGYRDGYSGTTWPGYKTPYGDIIATVEEQNHRELVLGEHTRSCGQWDAWEAVFSPVCEDGFPCRIYDKLTGKINRTVAEYWRDHFDLAHIIKKEWATLGPSLNGSLHVFVGGSDSFYLTNAVLDAKEMIENIDNSKSTGIEWVVGAHQGLGFQHCFRGYEYDAAGEPLPNSITRLTYAQAFLKKMADRFIHTAPDGSDTTSWRY
mmetsp:Transcript_75414/g.157214  ORF Transcript_75414/g.157214 Transcript_75414/m.157214 type:complete len:646 (+) Transcript_75414:75-2012(+)